MIHPVLVGIFAAHAAVFGRLYLAKGGHIHNLALSSGFIMLAIYHGLSGLAGPGGGTSVLAWPGLRWIGLGLCGLAIPALLTGLARRLQGRFRRMTFDQEA